MRLNPGSPKPGSSWPKLSYTCHAGKSQTGRPHKQISVNPIGGSTWIAPAVLQGKLLVSWAWPYLSIMVQESKGFQQRSTCPQRMGGDQHPTLMYSSSCTLEFPQCCPVPCSIAPHFAHISRTISNNPSQFASTPALRRRLRETGGSRLAT